MRTCTLLENATTTVTGSAVGGNPANTAQYFRNSDRAISANGTTSSGTGSATIVIEVSNNGTVWLASPLGTITLTLGTTATADGFQADTSFAYMRARVTAISGTGASVNCMVSEEG